MFPLVGELAGDGVPVTVTCRVLKLCRRQYYRWIDCPVSRAELDEAWVANAIFDAHRDDPEFGHRRDPGPPGGDLRHQREQRHGDHRGAVVPDMEAGEPALGVPTGVPQPAHPLAAGARTSR